MDANRNKKTSLIKICYASFLFYFYMKNQNKIEINNMKNK